MSATAKQLRERGIALLSIEEIAQAAGVNKTTIYRRWPTKGDLVLATLATLRPARADRFEPTGDLRADLLRLLRHKLAMIGSPGGRQLALSLLSLGTNDESNAVTRRLAEEQHRTSTALFQDAVDRGELAATVVPQFLSELLLSPVVQRAVVVGADVDDAYLERLVEHVLRGAGWMGPKGAPARTQPSSVAPVARPTRHGVRASRR